MRKPRNTLLVRHLPPTTKAGGGAAAQHRVGRLSSQACKHGFAARHAPNKESLPQSCQAVTMLLLALPKVVGVALQLDCNRGARQGRGP
jgi:hypothetical protein